MTAALALGSAAFGQTLKPYRLHVFKDSNGAAFNVGAVGLILAPNSDPNGGPYKIGINSLGVVGGTYEVEEDVYHGFVWFPNNLGVSGMAFDLRTLLDIHAEGADGDFSIVNDVCASRALFGFLGNGLGDGEAYAFPLDLTGGAIDAESLHTTSGEFSVAYGTDDGTTATVVGQASIDCDASDDYLRAFRTTWSPSGGPGTMTTLPMESGAYSAIANDVGRSSLAFVATGEDNGCVEDDEEPCDPMTCPYLNCTLPEIGALRWTGTSSTLVLDGLETTDSAVAGRAVNPSDDVAGWGRQHLGAAEEDICIVHAVVWHGSSAASHNLGNTMPDEQGSHESWAEGISQRDLDGCVTVVGTNTSIWHGIVWHGFEDAWCVEDLNDIAFRAEADPEGGSPCETITYLIERAFDINRFRHVTVLVSGPEGYHLGVLTSAADFNGDLKVDATDRAELYANYCSTCKDCQLMHDLDGNGTVGSSDMQLLTGTYWSGSALATVPTICECSQEDGMSGESLMDEAGALAALGFTGWESFLAWVVEADADAADAACDTLAYLLHGDQS